MFSRLGWYSSYEPRYHACDWLRWSYRPITSLIKRFDQIDPHFSPFQRNIQKQHQKQIMCLDQETDKLYVHENTA